MMRPSQPAGRRAPRVTLPDEQSPPEDTDAWVFTYMDVITLLVTLFVVLLSFASSSATALPASGSASAPMPTPGRWRTTAPPRAGRVTVA